MSNKPESNSIEITIDHGTEIEWTIVQFYSPVAHCWARSLLGIPDGVRCQSRTRLWTTFDGCNIWIRYRCLVSETSILALDPMYALPWTSDFPDKLKWICWPSLIFVMCTNITGSNGLNRDSNLYWRAFWQLDVRHIGQFDGHKAFCFIKSRLWWCWFSLDLWRSRRWMTETCAVWQIYTGIDSPLNQEWSYSWRSIGWRHRSRDQLIARHGFGNEVRKLESGSASTWKAHFNLSNKCGCWKVPHFIIIINHKYCVHAYWGQIFRNLCQDIHHLLAEVSVRRNCARCQEPRLSLMHKGNFLALYTIGHSSRHSECPQGLDKNAFDKFRHMIGI